MYGDAPVTVSVSITTVAPDAEPVAGRRGSTFVSRYVNVVSSRTDCTKVEIL